MKILIPIDGSACSLRAVDHAIARMQGTGALNIHLINVQTPLNSDVSTFVSEELIRGYHREEGEKALAEARARLEAAGLECRFHIKTGDAAEIIAEMAASRGCDQIVMGTHGRGPLAGLLMGSVATKVLHRSGVPVLLVK